MPNLTQVPYLSKMAWGDNGVCIMTGRLVESPRDDFMLVAEKELIAFERRERELRKQERNERAEQLKLPALERELQS
jgi:hypothetical protein